MYAVEQAKEKGLLMSVTMSSKTLDDLMFSPSLGKVLEDKGWRHPQPVVINKDVIEVALGFDIIIEEIEGIRIKAEKETEVKFHN